MRAWNVMVERTALSLIVNDTPSATHPPSCPPSCRIDQLSILLIYTDVSLALYMLHACVECDGGAYCALSYRQRHPQCDSSTKLSTKLPNRPAVHTANIYRCFSSSIHAACVRGM